MSVKVSPIEGYTEKSIAEIDSALGTRCGFILKTAISIEPRLESTIVAVDHEETGSGYAQICDNGDTIVSISTVTAD